MADPLLLRMATLMNDAYVTTPRWENVTATAHVVHAVVGNINALCWLGTMTDQEWILDDFNPQMMADPTEPQIGSVHAASLANVRQIVPLIRAHLDDIGQPPVYVLGHSKGSREGLLCHAFLKHFGYYVLGGYYFECPRVGGDDLATDLMAERVTLTQTWNSHGSDIFTLIPDGDGWQDVRPPLRLQVPDTFGAMDKHRMTGVLAGIAALSQP